MEQINHTEVVNGAIALPHAMPVALTPTALLNLALTQGASAETMGQFLAWQERRAFNEAMAAAQAEFPIVKKDRSASFGAGKASYDYATLAQIVATIQPVLARHGLSYRFRTLNDEKTIMVTCVVSCGGHSEENELTAPLDFSGGKNPLHALGSSKKYLMRYTLMAAFGLADTKDDDDGHGASPETITPKQAADIEALAIETRSDMRRLLAFYKAENIASIRACDLDDLRAKLEVKRRKGGAS